MLVSVTGGTGFVGAHTVAALTEAGHRVRLLVRDEARAARILDARGLPRDSVDLIAGDVLDAPSVARAVRGTDAVLHAAAVYSFDSRRRAALNAVNEEGTRIVLETARRAVDGLIVHVSSVVALYPSDGPVDGRSPVGAGGEAYAASKAAADRVARGHQAAGVPVVITYPPALLGPGDPLPGARPGDQTGRLRDVLRGLTPMWPSGGFPIGDVRDTAALHAVLLTGRYRPARCFAPGRYVPTSAYLRGLREITGRRLPALVLPPALLEPAGALADAVQRVWPWHIPVEYGAIRTCRLARPVSPGAETLGLTPRPLAATLRDTVGWLHRHGLLTSAQAGLAAHDALPVPAGRPA